MNAKLIGSLMVAVAGAGLALWQPWAIGGMTLSGEEPAGVTTQAPEALRRQVPTRTDEAPEQRVVVPSSTAESDSESPRTGVARVRGRVIHLDSTPAAGIELDFHAGMASHGREPDRTDVATTDANGWFEVEPPEQLGTLVASPDHGATLFAGRISPRAADEAPVVVIAPAISVAGVVRDENGRAVESARVRVVLPNDIRSRFSVVLDFSADPDWSVSSAADGRFDLGRVGRIAGAELLVTASGYLPTRRPLPSANATELALVLRKPIVTEGTLRGLVTDAFGIPVGDARVALGGETTMTDRDGGFVFSDKAAAKGKRLVAARPGWLPGVVEAPTGGDGKAIDWPGYVVVTIREPALAIHGRVVDAQGQGAAGVKVWVKDPSVFGRVDGSFVATESILGGAMDRSALMNKFKGLGPNADVRSFLRNTPTMTWNWARTDANGSFRLGGLMDRDYQLVVMQESTLLRVESGPVRGGARGVQVSLPADALFARIAGKVVDKDGHAVAGARIRPMIDAFSLTVKGRGTTSHQTLDPVSTAEDGSFEFSRVPRQHVYLRIDGTEVLPAEFGRGVRGGLAAVTGGILENMRVEVRRRLHVQVEVAGGAATADRLAILDGAGKRLPINVFRANSRRTTDELAITSEKTATFVVPDDAVTIVFYKNDKELRRQVLQLVPGRVNELRF